MDFSEEAWAKVGRTERDRRPMDDGDTEESIEGLKDKESLRVASASSTRRIACRLEQGEVMFGRRREEWRWRRSEVESREPTMATCSGHTLGGAGQAAAIGHPCELITRRLWMSSGD